MNMIIILVQIVRTISDDFEAKIWQRNFSGPVAVMRW
jgi:hypothetical protein